MEYRKTDKGYFVRIMRGEEIIETLGMFAAREGITTALFHAIGAVTEVELGFYSLGKKEYHWKTFQDEFEILSATGNITLLEGKPFIHLHAVIGDAQFNAYGGHVKRGIAGATCEVVLMPHDTKLERTFDSDIGLNLWKCSE